MATASMNVLMPRRLALATQLCESLKCRPISPCTNSHGIPPTPGRFVTPSIFQTSSAEEPPHGGRAVGSTHEVG